MYENQPDTRPNTALDDPRLYSGVLTSRVVASAIDLGVITFLTFIVYLLIAVLGIVTFGLSWLAFFLPIVPIIAIAYVALTVGSPAQATYGMRIAGVRLVRLDGRRVDAAYGALHSLLFWFSVTVLSPFVLLIGLFTGKRQLGHDLLLNTAMVRTNRL